MTEKRNNVNFFWTKTPGYAPWPSVEQKPPKDAPSKPTNEEGTNFKWVYFFGTHNYSWVQDNNVQTLTLNNLQDFKPDKKSKNAWKKAVKECEEILVNPRNKLKIQPYISISKTLTKKERGSAESVSSLFNKFDAKKKTPKNSIDKTKKSDLTFKKQKQKKVAGQSGNKTTKNKSTSKRKNSMSLNENDQNSMDRSLMPPPSKIRKHTQQNADDARKAALDKTYGFMRLNFCACALIRHLLCAGFQINFWSQETDDLNYYGILVEFAEHAAGTLKLFHDFDDFIALTDVFMMYTMNIDTTLDAHKILKLDHLCLNLLEGKSYVEFTTMGYSYSLEFAKMFSKKHVKYLEVQIQGNIKDVVAGEVVIIAAGNRVLNHDLKDVFKAISKKSFYLGSEAGKACKMNSILQSYRGVVITAFAEALAMANRCGITPETFCHVTINTNLDCVFLDEKGKFIMENNYTKSVQEDVASFQKDVKLGLDLSNRLRQNMPMAARAHEIIKETRAKGYINEDIAVVYRTLE